MNDFELKNKVVLVTGASSGIGAQVAVALSNAGATVIINGRNQQRLQKTLLSCVGSYNTVVVCDLSNEEEISKQFESVSLLDGIVHCCGVVNPYPAQYISTKQILETFSVNFFAPVLLTSFLLRKKKINKEASLVFMSSISAEFPYVGGSLYASSKSALEAYSRTLALELVKQKIRSNCISPALIKTPMYDHAEKNMINSNMDDLIAERYLLGVGLPVDVSNMTIFLLSKASRWITGKTFSMDGGVLLSSAK